jgi:dihydrofolate reductase
VLKIHQTLDGFVCTTSGDEMWASGHMDESVFTWETEHLWLAGVHIMGRKLYQAMESYWPSSTEAPAAPMNEIPKVVFSKTLKTTAWGPARIVNTDLSAEINRSRQSTDKVILAQGGASFAQSLARLNIIDEYRLLVHPVTLGSGLPCIATPLTLRFVSHYEFPSGVVALTYARTS